MELHQALNWLKQVAQMVLQVGAILGVSAPTFRPYCRSQRLSSLNASTELVLRDAK